MEYVPLRLAKDLPPDLRAALEKRHATFDGLPPGTKDALQRAVRKFWSRGTQPAKGGLADLVK